ncbi:MAG: hypothetical protein NZ750_02420 [Anaerolineae bacterium]|nr:hypothetical protein [Anaerolineae bacterium]MDW8173466.1 hypothetical protein [Anaerolineae bacterium]
MAQAPSPSNSDDALNAIFADDPILGPFLAHYPSYRLRLLMIGGGFYALAVLLIQALTWQIDRETASIFVPILYACAALVAFWYMAHYWNREVIVYKHGFVYREGRREVRFRYETIATVQAQAERLRLFGLLPYERHRYVLTSDQDERIVLDNLYRHIERLGPSLEQAIAQRRLPLLRQQLARGDSLPFGPQLLARADGLEVDGARLAWGEIKAERVIGDDLHLIGVDGQTLARLPLAQIDNLLLLLLLLKDLRS